eukprot:Gregarina_sp_Poly_1__6637@NODE_356_length_9282_cov_139_372219_g280_i1_p5_GENE_NODE_356_length_9282_cov_139_372219_g280_i1NODE_356_length_9282_cov_139_372219_g280_i1_p5_ORF_typecomplete_len148_score14_73_NODE_356_length_9282_cov_139_372219_g280_i154525895
MGNKNSISGQLVKMDDLPELISVSRLTRLVSWNSLQWPQSLKPRRLVALEGALEPSSAICKENGGDSGKTVTPNDRSGLMQSIFGVLTTGSSRKRVAAPAQNEPPTSEHKRRRRIKLRKYELDAIDMEQFFLQPSLQVRITRKSKQF